MLLFLRSIAILNAAVWFGAAVFLTVAVGPAFFSESMLNLLPRSHAGAAAQLILERYFYLQYWCAGIALAHLLGEWLYTGRPLRRWALYLVLGLLGISLAGGLGVQPKLKRLHLEMYGVRSTPQQRQLASKSFGLWHGLAQTMNVLMTLGLLVHLLHTTSSAEVPRLLNANKFRG